MSNYIGMPSSTVFAQRLIAEKRKTTAQLAAGELDVHNPPPSLIEDQDFNSPTYGQQISRIESLWTVSTADYATGRRAGIACQCRLDLAVRNALAGKSHVARRDSADDCAAVLASLRAQAEQKVLHETNDRKLQKGAHVTLSGLPGGE